MNLTLRIMWSVWERSDFKCDEMEIILFQGNFYIFTKIFVWETHRAETYWRSPGWVDDLCTLVQEPRRNIFNWFKIFSNQPRLPPSTETRNISSGERVVTRCGVRTLAGIIVIIVFWEYIDPCQENAAGNCTVYVCSGTAVHHQDIFTENLIFILPHFSDLWDQPGLAVISCFHFNSLYSTLQWAGTMHSKWYCLDPQGTLLLSKWYDRHTTPHIFQFTRDFAWRPDNFLF